MPIFKSAEDYPGRFLLFHVSFWCSLEFAGSEEQKAKFLNTIQQEQKDLLYPSD